VSITVRAAQPRDASALVALASTIAGEEEGWLLADSRWRSASDERRYIRAIQRHPDAALFVAETSAGELIGRLAVMRDPHPASTSPIWDSWSPPRTGAGGSAPHS
jgi:RimJ/RimL family protein N-acetyltransferase